MNILVTGGAGFIGRWVVKKLLEKGERVIVLDDLSNGSEKNIEEFRDNPNFQFIKGDITDKNLVSEIFSQQIDTCIHLAAQIEVQKSLDDPTKSFETNVVGTFNILQGALKNKTKVVLIGTCMVYDMATEAAIDEKHPVKPVSVYAGTKLAAEELAESYCRGLGLPVVILRPFNVYGAFQKTNSEGGVVSIFIKKELKGEGVVVFGDGMQTRDLLYVEDCADFIVNASFNEKAIGEVINAGIGQDITINDLVKLIVKDEKRIKHVEHHHPQSEIRKLICDYSKAKELLDWEPKVSLKNGIEKTRKWISENES